MNKPKKYNGWANYETWSIALFIDDDEYYQETVIEAAKKLGKYELRVWLRDFVEEEILSIQNLNPYQQQLINAALAEVDFAELQEKYQQKLKENE